jgi:hypothetical protein
VSDIALRHAWTPINLTHDIQKTRMKNKVLLLKYKQWLRQKKVRENMISNHVKNCDFFLNEFLVHLDIFSASEGYSKINMFLGYWFIKRAIWSTPAAIKSNAVSLEMFYTFLYEKGDIKQEYLKELSSTIKKERSKWIISMKWHAKHESVL